MPARNPVKAQINKLIRDEQALVLRQSAEIRLPAHPTLQQVIDRLELAKTQGIPATSKIGTDHGGFMIGANFQPLYSLSVRFGEVREDKPRKSKSSK